MLRSQKNYSVKTRIILKGKNTVIKLRFKFAKWRKKNYFETKIKKNILKSKVLFILRFFLKFTKMYVSVSTYTYININMNFSVNIYFFNIIILNIKYINTLIFQYIFLFFL